LGQDYSTGNNPHNQTDFHVVAAALGMEKELEYLDLHIRMDHRAVIAALGKKEELDDPGHRVEHPNTSHEGDARNTIMSQ
jgi:hypothetical protein